VTRLVGVTDTILVLAEDTLAPVDVEHLLALHEGEVLEYRVLIPADSERPLLATVIDNLGLGELGTGLGLAMVYGMVQRHSAEIDIESTVSKGTTVCLAFTAPVAAVAGSVQPAAAYSVPSHLRILVVDDDPLLLKSLRDTLEADGHIVVTANNGQGGIDAFRTSHSTARHSPW
jgi:hypothetical protein